MPFITVILINTLNAAAGNMTLSLVTEYALKLGAELTLASTIAGLMSMTSLIICPIAGFMTDRVNKKRLLILNKADLADPAATAAWEEALRTQETIPLSLDSRAKDQAARIRKQLELLAREKSERDRARGIKNRPVRIMVAGIPNVGKSTLINSLAGRASTKTGDKPGVTKGLQWIRLSAGMELMDTPGILWPRFDDEATGVRLALMGAISEDVLPLEELAARGIVFLKENYPGVLEARYGLTAAEPHEILEEIARNQGFLQKGSQPDPAAAARRLLNDWQAGKLGRISLELPEEEI